MKAEFVKPFLESDSSVHDRLRTAVDLIAHIIVAEYSEDVSTLFATGGGALNQFLVSQLREALSPLQIELIIPATEIIECKEAILMALMGYLRVQNKINVLSSVTGATSDTVAGCIYL